MEEKLAKIEDSMQLSSLCVIQTTHYSVPVLEPVVQKDSGMAGKHDAVSFLDE